MNPLLDFSGLPRFASIKAEHVTPAVDDLLQENRTLIAELARMTEAPAWDNFIAPLDEANERLSRAWGQVGHLNAVMNTPELREAYNGNLPKITAYFTELSQNELIFAKLKALRESAGFAQLSPAQQRIIGNELRDFRLSGAELPADKKTQFKALKEKLGQISSRFSDNLLDATNAYSRVVTDEKELDGVPEDIKQSLKQSDSPGWKLTLHAPCYLPVMQYATHRPLREELYRSYVTRASEFGKSDWDNSALIREIVQLRRESAQMLGFKNYAELSLAPKMARSPAQVLEFLEDLAQRVKPYAQKDLAELKAFAREELGIDRLETWDVGFASECLRERRYSFSEQEVKRYFPEPKVLEGLFRVVQTLFGVIIVPGHSATWHPDVKFFEIRSPAGNALGQFFLDLYARPSKRGGAWMDDAITRRKLAGGVQIPVAYLTCNFAAPLEGQPALFTHDEVTTLFHEFGHGLHHLLTQVDYRGVSGINGVEWDAVELPSQFMENFCWEWDVLANMTSHAQTGAALPRELFEKMLAAKNFQSGLQFVRQLEFSLFDMRLHYDFDPAGTALQLIEETRQQVAVIFPPAYNRFPHSFSHIFAGGYAAGYYSYKWAEVLSADAYSLFEEQGVLNPDAGRRFWQEVLGVGGSRPALDSFVAFRGREPKIDALLRHSGIAVA
ncbi:MAG: M3 family peptidase [Betaproteobacteria bacterium]|nr:M3 family peptidase [Betaproteobacteria bacterium]